MLLALGHWLLEWISGCGMVVVGHGSWLRDVDHKNAFVGVVYFKTVKFELSKTSRVEEFDNTVTD